MNPSQTMLLLTYTPRADSNDRGYEEWLREVDNPFFNSIPGIVHYANWKIVGTKVGSVPFTHFDFMHIESLDALEKVWGNARVKEFAAGWTEKWAIHPDATDMSVNYQVCLCSEVASPAVAGARTNTLLLLPYTPRADAQSRRYDEWLRNVDNPFLNAQSEIVHYTNWRIREAVLGRVEYTDFDAMYVDSEDAFDCLLANPEAGEHITAWIKKWGARPDDTDIAENFTVAVAKLIASPD